MKITFQQLSLTIAIACTPPLAMAGSMLGAYVNGDGWLPEEISALNNVSAKPLAVVNFFSGFNMNWNNALEIQAGNIVAKGAMPMITWMPIDSTRKADNLLPEIVAGTWDSYIDTWIAGMRTWLDSYPADSRPTVLLRFAHEFNGNWYPWANDPGGLQAAWRYVHNRFELAGINGSVEWVWCANNVSTDNHNDINAYYPGDTVVDWTSLDGYNWGSNYSFTLWKNFDSTFSAPYVKLVTDHPGKPVLLAEVASAEPHDQPDPGWGQDGTDADRMESKELWVQDMYSRISTDYPAIRAISWFNTNKELSWALNGSINTGLTAYNNAIASPYYTSTFTPLAQGGTTDGGGGGKSKPTKGSGGGGSGSGGGKGKTTLTSSSTLASDPQPVDSKSQTTGPVAQTGIDHALLVSHMPAVVGEKLLEMEAEGFRHLPAAVLEKWRDRHLQGQ